MEILYTVPTETGGVEFGIVVFDATIKELHESGATITDHPIDQGADISDHIRPELDLLSVEVHVSNSPVRPVNGGPTGSVQPMDLGTLTETRRTRGANVGGASDKVQAAQYETLQRGAYAQVLTFDSEFDRRVDVYQTLRRLIGQELEVTTDIRHYEGLAIAKLGTPITSDDGDGVLFSVDFKTVRRVSSSVVDVPEPLETRAEHQRRLGARHPEEVEEHEAEENTSILTRGIETVRGIFH